jgi:hypothetical protein
MLTQTMGPPALANAHHQLYSQITFRFYDVFLGLVCRSPKTTLDSICLRFLYESPEPFRI